MTLLKDKILNRQSGILLYGLTPPKIDNTPERNKEITATRIERIKSISPDGLVIYDLQDESSRINSVRPYDYIQTVDSIEYGEEYLREIDIPKIIYRCVGKYTTDNITHWLANGREKFSVFVGIPSESEKVKTHLNDAYNLAQAFNDIYLGGVAIAERHDDNRDEHQRLIRKYHGGVKYFISQCIFDVNKTKSLLSDYYYYCRDNNLPMVPFIITITPCGSLKTMEFLKWLGVSIPIWIENDLVHSKNTLQSSLDFCMELVEDISEFCINKKIPLGCNVESVSVKKDEILASFELVKKIDALLVSKGLR